MPQLPRVSSTLSRFPLRRGTGQHIHAGPRPLRDRAAHPRLRRVVHVPARQPLFRFHDHPGRRGRRHPRPCRRRAGRYGCPGRHRRAAAAVLLDPVPHVGVTYSLTGPQALLLTDVASVITAELGRPVRYQPETVAEAYASRAGYVGPSWQVDTWVSTYTHRGRQQRGRWRHRWYPPPHRSPGYLTCGAAAPRWLRVLNRTAIGSRPWALSAAVSGRAQDGLDHLARVRLLQRSLDWACTGGSDLLRQMTVRLLNLHTGSSRAYRATLAGVPPCAGECRFVCGKPVGNAAAARTCGISVGCGHSGSRALDRSTALTPAPAARSSAAWPRMSARQA